MDGMLGDRKGGVKNRQVSGPADWGWGAVYLHGEDLRRTSVGVGQMNSSGDISHSECL